MANRSTVTIDVKTAEKLFEEIESMRKSLEALKKNALKLLPAKYGSDAWWEKEESEADEDIRKGRVVELKSVKDLDRPLTELFP